MKCKDVGSLASWYVSGELALEKTTALEAHMSECAACRAEIEAARRSLRALGQPRREYEAPDVLAAVRERVVRRAPIMPAFRWGVAAVGASAIILGIWFAVGLRTPGPGPEVAITQSGQPSAAEDVARPPRVESEADDTAVVEQRETPPKPVVQAPKPRRIKPHRQPAVVQQPPQLEAPTGAEPPTQYFVVFRPEVTPAPLVSTPSGVGDAESSVSDIPEVSSYSIRMVDQEAGTETNVAIHQEIDADSVRNLTVEYTVEQIADNRDEERSHQHEDDSHRTDPDTNALVG